MPKRLGYETTACMMLIRREINKHMIKQKINKSKLVNDLLLKWYERKLCHHCLGGVIHTRNCVQCKEDRIFCDDDKCNRVTRFCNCDWSAGNEMAALDKLNDLADKVGL